MTLARTFPPRLEKAKIVDQFVLKPIKEELTPLFGGLITCLVSAESGRIVENRLRSLSCQIIQAIFLERNLR